MPVLQQACWQSHCPGFQCVAASLTGPEVVEPEHGFYVAGNRPQVHNINEKKFFLRFIYL